MDLHLLWCKRSDYIKVLNWLSLSLLQWFSNFRITGRTCENTHFRPQCHGFWSSTFWVGPGNFHFYQMLRGCSYCWPETASWHHLYILGQRLGIRNEKANFLSNGNEYKELSCFLLCSRYSITNFYLLTSNNNHAWIVCSLYRRENCDSRRFTNSHTVMYLGCDQVGNKFCLVPKSMFFPQLYKERPVGQQCFTVGISNQESLEKMKLFSQKFIQTL